MTVSGAGLRRVVGLAAVVVAAGCAAATLDGNEDTAAPVLPASWIVGEEGRRSHHPVAAPAPDGWLLTWTSGFEVRADRLRPGVAPAPVASWAGGQKSDVVRIPDGWVVGWQELGQSMAACTLGDDGTVGDRREVQPPGSVPSGSLDLVVRDDGSVWGMWYRGYPPWPGLVVSPGDYRLARVDGLADVGLAAPVRTQPGGGSGPDVEVGPDGALWAAIQVRHGERVEGRYPERIELSVLEEGVVTGSTVVHDGGHEGASRPGLAVGPERALVVFRTGSAGQTDAWMRAVTPDLQPAAEPVLLAAGGDRPAVAAHRDGFLVAWEQPGDSSREVWVGLLAPDATDWVAPPAPVSPGGEPQARPALAVADDGRALITFEAGPGSDGPIVARVLTIGGSGG